MFPKQKSGEILAFRHCDESRRMFALELPEKCPICSMALVDEDDYDDVQHVGVIPVNSIQILPSPLRSAWNAPFSLALCPSKGDFISDYRNSCDLHICLTSSDGRIAEFDQRGVRLLSQEEDDSPLARNWQSSLVIRLSEHLDENVKENWNNKLEEFCGDAEKWSADSYNSNSRNCFDFVLEFLKFVNVKDVSSASDCKTTFCEQFIVPRTRLLARYISLYRKLRSDSFVVLDSN